MSSGDGNSRFGGNICIEKLESRNILEDADIKHGRVLLDQAS